MSASPDDAGPAQHVERWVQAVVVRLNLCPFAAAPLRQGRVRFVESRGEVRPDVLEELLDEIELLDADVAATTLLVLPRHFSDFAEFLELVADAEELLEAVGRESDYQVASFHPDYVFADTPADDPANATNRAPFPTLHLLRCADVAHAIEQHPDTESIPQRNVALLRRLAAG